MDFMRHAAVTRRELLRAGVAAGVVAALGTHARAQTPSGPLLTKPVPASGQRLPVIGIGTNAFRLSNLDSLRPLLARFHELGAQVIDTAAMYGDSESAIGQALADLGLRKQMFIATKLTGGPMRMGPPPGAGRPTGGPPGGGPPGGGPPPQRGPQLYGAESFEHSLKALQTDYIDLLQVHSMVGIDILMPLLLEWKKAGRIRYIGTTTSESEDHPRLLECMEKYPLDFIQVNYSIANRDAAAAVLPAAIARKMGVLINVPLGGRGGGNLAASRERPLPPWAAALGISSWAQFMLKYVVSHPAVTVTIPGSTKVEHLEDDQMAGRGTLLDAATRLKMEAYWDAQA
ncbi:MAG: aldo/keto reductase [Steroidobacteraceae bacterium]|jgi:aryl-alcohol dehydrogenase-like predicted oxidoreductase